MAFIPSTEDQWVFCQKMYNIPISDIHFSDPDIKNAVLSIWMLIKNLFMQHHSSLLNAGNRTTDDHAFTSFRNLFSFICSFVIYSPSWNSA